MTWKTRKKQNLQCPEKDLPNEGNINNQLQNLGKFKRTSADIYTCNSWISLKMMWWMLKNQRKTSNTLLVKTMVKIWQ